VKPADAVLYTVAQCLGALAGVGVVASVGGAFAKRVQFGLTVPGEGYSPGAAFVAEAATSFVLMILYCVGNGQIAARTPYLTGALVGVMVFVEATLRSGI
jgi:glycerol uptake facilitator-like aquaporin